MNKLFIFCFLSAIIMFSCTRENTVIESAYPDGSPKRVCIYRTKGDIKELIKETTYYKGKKMQMAGAFKNNKRDGRWIYYYENGKVWSEGSFKEGKSDGKRVTYFENGTIRYEAWYKEDQKIGKWRFFNEKGQFLGTINYDQSVNSTKK